MYVAKLIENKSEILLGKVDKPFFVPIELIELKLNADDLDNAITQASNRLDPIINNPSNMRIEQLSNDSLILSFRNRQDGLKVSYELQAYN